MNHRTRGALALLAGMACLLPSTASRAAEPTVHSAIEHIIARMRASLDPQQMMKVDMATVARFVTPQDRETLATRYWSFDTNVPVVVSIIRPTTQKTLPFWLAEGGFVKTELVVRNEEYDYDVWQKAFPAGHVGLGIPGFDGPRPDYFVSVGPQHAGDKVTLSRFYPADQVQYTTRLGSSTYHDWTELVLTQVPPSLAGQILLPTTRGRAREARLINGFRMTPLPSSATPDQVMLTWSADPRTTQTIQWRASLAATSGAVRWRKVAGSGSWHTTPAAVTTLTDTRILNDPSVHRFTATLRGLTPGTAYSYTVGHTAAWSAPATFRTAPTKPRPFSFVWLSDTHNHPQTEGLLARATTLYPKIAFCTISGDFVGTGQYRDDWDQFFNYAGPFARQHPILPAIGNHDCIDGLGADLYLSLFGLPLNGSPKIQPKRSYTVRYGDALFIVLDSSSEAVDEAPWLEQVLKHSDARWMFAMFHFPPYAPEETYPDIQRYWCSLFDRYHVDFVLNGHVHHLERTKPIRGGRAVASPAQGTIYLMTVAVPQGGDREEHAPYLVLDKQPGPAIFHVFSVAHDRVQMRAYDIDGKLVDSLDVTK